jgi:FMN-dependent NADH-azoreductase
MNILHIDSSILGDGSVSRALSREIVETLAGANPGAVVTRRDLAVEPLDHLTGAHVAAMHGAPAGAEIEADVHAGERALEEFLAADIVVIGAPMYNFSVPSQLKAWIDRLAVAGKTFRYGENGPVGLAGDKRVVVASSRGGFFSVDTPFAAFDHQETYLRTLFGFLGVTRLEFVRAEGVAVGPEARAQALEDAKRQTRGLAA